MSVRVIRASFAIFTPALFLFLSLLPARAEGDAAAVFKDKCAVCHAANGDGSTAVGKSMKLRDLRSSDVQKQSDVDLKKITASGKGKMPGYQGKLSDAQIDELVTYMRALAKKSS